MARVTLLLDKGQDYTVNHGTASYQFKGGVSKIVPPAIALICQKKTVKNKKGVSKPLFKVEDLPVVVSAKTSTKNMERPNPDKKVLPMEQNVPIPKKVKRVPATYVQAQPLGRSL